MGSRSRKRSRAVAPPASGEPAGGKTAAAKSSRAERDATRRRRSDAGGAQATRAAGTRRRAAGERPRAPWGSFPLTELVILLALVLCVAGFAIGVEEPRGRIMFLAGLALGSLGGLELALRDHFAGYRSHSTLLAAAAAAVAIIGVSLLLRATAPALPTPAVLLADLGVGALVFTLSFFRLRGVFQRRSGGLSFR